jgi:hypothetical protein
MPINPSQKSSVDKQETAIAISGFPAKIGNWMYPVHCSHIICYVTKAGNNLVCGSIHTRRWYHHFVPSGTPVTGWIAGKATGKLEHGLFYLLDRFYCLILARREIDMSVSESP